MTTEELKDVVVAQAVSIASLNKRIDELEYSLQNSNRLKGLVNRFNENLHQHIRIYEEEINGFLSEADADAQHYWYELKKRLKEFQVTSEELEKM